MFRQKILFAKPLKNHRRSFTITDLIFDNSSHFYYVSSNRKIRMMPNSENYYLQSYLQFWK